MSFEREEMVPKPFVVVEDPDTECGYHPSYDCYDDDAYVFLVRSAWLIGRRSWVAEHGLSGRTEGRVLRVKG